MAVKVTTIAAQQNEKKRKRVAAYARVSTLFEEQEESFETQVEYYTQFIQKNPEWVFAGVYADQGLSGTSSAHRPEFQRMLADCRKGLIDLILVKSISRFGRNALEVLNYVNELKDIGVEVRADRENLSTFDPQSEMILNFMVIIAQEESRSLSLNTRWALEKMAEKGIRHIGNNRVLGYDEIDGELTPNQDAWIVKLIYERFATGVSKADIIDELSQRGAVRLHTRSNRFSQSVLEAILKNEIYVGDRLLQKQPHINYLTKKPDRTIEYKQYEVTDAHTPIVERELWDKVQTRLKEESELRAAGIGSKKRSNHYMYSRLFCGECGEPLTRRTVCYHGIMQKVWKCRGRIRGQNGCMNDVISEEDLFKIISDLLGFEWAGLENVTEESFGDVLRVTLYADRTVDIEVVDYDGEN